jgi:hypothetical protein
MIPSAGKTPETGATPCIGNVGQLMQPPGRGAMPSEGIQGDERYAYVTLDTYNRDERGIAYGTRALG